MTQPDLFEDSTPPEAQASGVAAACSAEALQKVDVKTLRRLCLEEYERRPFGATADEICKAVRFKFTGVMPDELSIRPRVAELKAEGLLVPTGERRQNKKGNNCAVLIHREYARREEL